MTASRDGRRQSVVPGTAFADNHDQMTLLPHSSCRNPVGACWRVEAVADESMDGEWPGAADYEGCEASAIEQDDLVTHRSELRAPLRSRRGA